MAMRSERYALLFCLLAMLPAWGGAATFWVLPTQGSALLQSAGERVVSGLSLLGHQSTHRDIGAPIDGVIALGYRAAESVNLVDAPVPTVYAMLPMRQAEGLLAKAGGRRAALVLDQPLARQLRLIRLALPEVRRVGALVGPATLERARQAADVAADLGLVFEIELVKDDRELAPALNRLLPRVDALLALPDPAVHHSQSVPHILLTTFHARVPVIAYSEAYVLAGALIGLYSSEEQLVSETLQLATGLVQGRRRAGLHFPARFVVSVNPVVERSLGLRLPSANELQRRLEAP